MFLLKCGNTDLPGPVKMSINDEIIWSSDTGRTLDGTMMGDVVAEKKNLKIDWSWLTAQQAALIKSCLVTGFFPITFQDYGTNVTIENYRGTISKDVGGYIGDGVFYYKSVSVDIVQR